ncbi:MAG: ATP-binding protein [Spirochaetes bacterium]|nr:ATP-binding protein [Spirochaetota bacterium]
MATHYKKDVKINVPAFNEYLEAIRNFIEHIPAVKIMGSQDRFNLLLAVEEASENVIKHAYDEKAKGDIEIDITTDDEKITIIISDRGKGYVPKEKLDWDHVTELKVGGLGIYIIEKLMDRVKYHIDKEKGGTRIKMVKYFNGKKAKEKVL